MTAAGARALRERLAWLERNTCSSDRVGCSGDDEVSSAWLDVQQLLAALDDFLEAERTRATDRMQLRTAMAVAADELGELVAGCAPNAVIAVSTANMALRVASLEAFLRLALRNRTPTEPPPGGGR